MFSRRWTVPLHGTQSISQTPEPSSARWNRSPTQRTDSTIAAPESVPTADCSWKDDGVHGPISYVLDTDVLFTTIHEVDARDVFAEGRVHVGAARPC